LETETTPRRAREDDRDIRMFVADPVVEPFNSADVNCRVRDM